MILRRLLLLALLAPLAGCAIAPASAPAPRAWSAMAPPDSVARWAVASCRRLTGVDRACVERALYRVVDSAGVASAIRALDRVVVEAPSIAADAHGLAHGLGIAAYRSPETLAATFASCPPTQISGCYHGVIQGYFLSLKRSATPLDSAVLDATCAPHRASTPVYFQCGHGMGHGLMAYHEGHLPRALEGCDEASQPFIRESCYGGAFMENIVGVTHPHHTAEAHADLTGSAGDGHAGHGEAAASPAHAGHGTGAAAAEHAGHGADAAPAHHADHGTGTEHGQGGEAEWVPLRRSDLLYPCTVVEARYHAACYDMQSSAALALTLGDLSAVARACSRAPAAHVKRCYASIGRDVSALAGNDHRRAVGLCERTGKDAVNTCLAGVASALYNRAADPADAIAFCRDVPSGPGKDACYATASAVVRDAPMERRDALCSAAEEPYADACRAGAGIARAGSE